MSGSPEHDLAHNVAQDLSPRRWVSFAVNVAANVVANLATAGVLYAYARLTGLLTTTETTRSLDSLALGTALAGALALITTIVVRRRH